MKRIATGLFLTLLCGAFHARAAQAAMKCLGETVTPTTVRAPGLGGGPAEPAPPPSYPADRLPVPTVYLLDLEIVDSAAFHGADPETVESLYLICSDESHRLLGVEPNTHVVVLFTEPGPRAGLEQAVEAVARAQDEHLARHGAFAESLEALALPDLSPLISIDLAAGEDGRSWSARATYRVQLGREALEATARGARSGTRRR